MALTLEDLIAGQKKLEESTKQVERMSVEQIKQMSQITPVQTQPLIKEENLKILNGNILKLIDAVKKNTTSIDILATKKAAPVKIEKPSSVQSADITEREIEQSNEDKKLFDVLVKIEKNTRGGEIAPGKKSEPDGGLDLLGIGGIATALALALSSIVGIISGYVATLKVFGIDLAKGVTKVKNVFGNFFGGISSALDDAVKGIKTSLSTSIADSKIGKMFSAIKTGITTYFKPVSAALDEIESGSKFVSGIVSGIKSKFSAVTGFIDDIGKYFNAFKSVFGGFAKIVSKIAMPVMVLMTIFDTIKGALKGFEEEGIVGGIKGAIKGFVNSLITAPMDMLKNLVSWIAGAFGFDEIEKSLDSFSFTDMFNELIEMIFHPIDTLKSILSGITSYLSNVQIPKFDIDVFGYKTSFGPFKPFAALGSSPSEAASPKGSPQYAEGKIRKAEPMAPEKTEANVVYNKSREAEAASQIKQPATNTVVSAPTTITKQTKNIAVKQPIRNSDSSLNSYLKSRYAT